MELGSLSLQRGMVLVLVFHLTGRSGCDDCRGWQESMSNFHGNGHCEANSLGGTAGTGGTAA